MANNQVKCSVDGCGNTAEFEVILYDIYMGSNIFFERDFTCPFLCFDHVIENEKTVKMFPKDESNQSHLGTSLNEILEEGFPDLVSAGTTRTYRDVYHYPYSNKNRAQGFTIYRPLKEKQ